MQRHRQEMDPEIATEFLSRCFSAGETIAVLLRRESPTSVLQKITTLENVLAPRYLSWLMHENARGANTYVAANPLLPGSRKRTKESIAEVRHLYLDLDIDGDIRLAALRSSDAAPVPSTIVSTSKEKYQFLWRVKCFSFAQQESTLKLLAITFGGDPACTDCNRVLRLPGFLNHKYDPSHRVTAEYPSDAIANPGDFRLDIAEANPILLSAPISGPKRPGKRTHSEDDWAWVLHELAHGRDGLKLTRELASRRSDKSNPLYYAQRTVDVASARIWLLEGVPVANVVTMLEVRRRFEIPTALCSARAREIALTAERMIARKKTA